MEEIAGWFASLAIIVAAMMVAANLGTRITGWGFVVFTIGSVAWVVFALLSGQDSLLLTNGFLVLVNLAGVWRWLGRQAQYEDGSWRAAHRSSAARVPTLFSAELVIGSPVIGAGEKPVATVVDMMMRCGQRDISYVVLSQGGVGGIGERLHAISPQQLTFTCDEVRCVLDSDGIAALPRLAANNWPPALPAVGGKLEKA
jgi:hypothetical protein